MAMRTCPICRMEQSDENQTCQACAAVFDDSPVGATAAPAPEPEPAAEPAPEIPDDEAAPNGEVPEEETEKAE